MLVHAVEQESPAARAGLRKRDIIVGFRDAAVASVADLHRLLDADAIDRSTELVVLRGGQRVTLDVRPRELETRRA